MRVTLSQIADRAGVSVSAVSQVLNNHPHAQELRAETREKIQRTVQELHYCRNENAAEFRSGIVKTIALLLEFSHPAANGEAAGRIQMGMMQEVARRGFNIRVYDASDLEHTERELQKYAIQYVIASCFTEPLQDGIADFCHHHHISLCFIQESCRDDFPLVYTDDRLATFQVTERLLAQGHRRFAMLKPEDDVHFSIQRHAGVVDCLGKHGLELQFVSARHDINDHFADLQSWLSLPEDSRPTAFVCTDDIRANQVLITALRLGLNVPDQCRIYGFGDVLAHHLYFPLGTVHQPFEDMGRIAVDYVLSDVSENHSSPRLQLCPVTIIDDARRHTVAP